MRSDFIPSEVQDASDRRRQPTAAFNAAPVTPTEAFAAFLTDPSEIARHKADMGYQVAAAPPGPPQSPFRGISAFTGAPAVIPSAVVPPVETLTESPISVEAAPLTSESAQPAFAAPQPTAIEPATPALSPESTTVAPAAAKLREPTPRFAAAKSDAPLPAPSAELVRNGAAFGARAVTYDEAMTAAAGDASSIPQGPKLFGDDGMTVADFFSVINPLQHLPLVGSLYREITGDTIKPGARVLGGMLFGGPVGMVGGAFNAAVEQDLGTDPGGAFIALVQGRPIGPPPSANLAAAPRPAATPTDVAAIAAPKTALSAPVATTVAQAPVQAPVSLAAPRVASPTRAAPPPAEARILPSNSSSLSALNAEPGAAPAPEPAKQAIPVSVAPSAPAAAASDPKSGFAIAPAGKEFAVPARMNNVQPRQPVPVVRADLSRARELAPMAPLTARPEAPRPDRSASPATLLTPGIMPSGPAPSGLSATSLPPVGVAPLGVPGLPASALPDAMTRALDKYDALLKSRKGGVLNQQS